MALQAAAATRKGLLLSKNGGPSFRQVRGLRTFLLPDLPYDYEALEPVISGEIMRLHHQKHHQTYVSNFNKALDQLDRAMAEGHFSVVVQLQSAIKIQRWRSYQPFNFLEKSHSSPRGGEPPKGSLCQAIDDHFGSLEALIQKINSEGSYLQGCGWVWLALDIEQRRLSVETTLNQDDPLLTKDQL